MNWFFIALINPLAHAFSNHFDKYLISRYIKGGSVGGLILFSSFFSIFGLVVILIAHPNVFATVSFIRMLILMGNGCLLLLAILLYLNALKRNEPSIVAPFFQSIPIFGFILSYMILRESLNYNQILASGLIVIGGLVLSVETFSGSYRIKKRLLLLMGGSCILYALNVVIFKSIAIQQGFLDSLFWDMVGKVMLGLFLFSFIQSYRKQFYYLLKANRLTIIGLNILNEGIALIGEIALVFASLFAPITVVQSVGGLQPAFVFFLGVIFSLLFPKFSQESLRPNVLVKKLIGIVIISAGAFLINI